MKPTLPDAEAQLPNAPQLRTRVSTGLAWSGGARITQQGLQFAFSVILARLLSPPDYGLMAMALVFTGVAGVIAEFGFSSALVQKAKLDERDADTVFWISLGSGVLLATVVSLSAPLLASFYAKPTLRAIFPVVSLTFVFSGAGNVAYALLQREMNFRAIAWCDTIAFVGAALLGIGLAAAGAGVWALVTQAVFTPLALGIARCISAKWFPRFRFSVEAVKSMTAFTANLYAFNFVNYWARNGDNLLIGKFFGASSLGVYNRAYALMLLPITQINSVVSQVAFPTLASLQHDKARVANLYCRALGMVTLIAFPVMSGMACVATPFILVLYGSKWAGVAPLLQILAVVGMIQVVVNSMGWIFLSQGRTDLLFRYGVIFSVAVVGSFLVGVRLGSPRALALSYGLANLICFLPWLYAASKVASTSIWQIVSSFTAPLASSFIMAGCVWGTARILPLGMPPVELLIIETAVGAAVYIVLVLAMKPESLGELKRLIRNYRNRAAVST